MKFGRWSRCAVACGIVVTLAGLTRDVADRVRITAPPPPALPVSADDAPAPGVPFDRSRARPAPARAVDLRAHAAIDHAWASALAPRPSSDSLTSASVSSSALAPSAAAAAPTLGEPADRSGSKPITCTLDTTVTIFVSEALQDCIDHAPPYSAIEIPSGLYVLDHQVVVSSPLTIRTAGSANGTLSCARSAEQEHCAVLIASNGFADNNGLLYVGSTGDVRLEHIVIDGNHAARLSSSSAFFCLNGFNTYGFNVSVINCTGCALDDVLSMNALCGTGMVWSGGRATIQQSEFRGNGSAAKPGLWADGLTLVYAPDSTVHGNLFVDNSDVALILGYGVNTQVENNVIRQRGQAAFAGLMLHNFHSDDLSFRGDFRGAVIANNIIDCGDELCVFGIQLGPRPWDDTRNILGGEVFDNDVRGAKVGINVDGAGSRMAPTTVYANAVTDTPADSVFSGCPQPVQTDWMNVAPTSVVDRRDDVEPTGVHLSYLCELSSSLTAEDQ